jgi:hypothetical protein
MIRIYGPKDKAPKGIFVVNTTSRSNDIGQGLSPFFLGPVKLYGRFKAMNVENGWQNSKVYAEHVDENGDPNDDYWNWAMRGWLNRRAVRYPMGKGAVPLYSYWNGQKLSYVEARKKIYAPIYTKAVVKTRAFHRLKEIYKQHGEIGLWDFDGYDHHKYNMSLKDVLDCENRKMGHAFVLSMLLQGYIKGHPKVKTRSLEDINRRKQRFNKLDSLFGNEESEEEDIYTTHKNTINGQDEDEYEEQDPYDIYRDDDTEVDI